MDLSGIIKNLAAKAEGNRDKDTEIIGSDGLRHCVKCGGARQTRVAVFGGETVVPCLCPCQNAAQEAEAAKRRDRERAERLDRYRSIGLPDEQTKRSTFSADDGQDPRTINAALRYCDLFPEWRKEGKGLIFYGRPGSGKSFAAACICNELIQRGYKPLFTTIQRVTEATKDLYSPDRMEQLDSLSRFDLVVLDDLGVERQTTYMTERICEIVDGLYRSMTPVIVTTNCDPRRMSNDTDLGRAQVYDRLLERCHPIAVTMESRRKTAGRNAFDEANRALGL